MDGGGVSHCILGLLLWFTLISQELIQATWVSFCHTGSL